MQLETDPDRAAFASLCERAALLAGKGFQRRVEELAGARYGVVNTTTLTEAIGALQRALASDPRHAVEAHARLWREGLAFWQSMAGLADGGEPSAIRAPAAGDRRFADRGWSEDLTFAILRQGYLLLADWVEQLVDADGLAPATRRQLKFYARQLLSALAPTNFALTNPEVVRQAEATEGRSLLNGLERFVADLERGDGRLAMRRCPEDAFQVGETLATTPGKVVFQNDLMELLHYAPTNPKVRRRPLLIVPPWINKYYILDLQPTNSLVGFAVAQGFDVFLISWVNPDASLAHMHFDDYVREGPLAALAAIEAATTERQVNVLGFCIGGVLTASAIAHLRAEADDRVTSATFLATLFDFTDVGDMAVFIDDKQVAAIETHTRDSGFLESHHLADMFAMLRENDLIWSFFVRTYLLGKDPPAFDLLYWNGDTTRLPAAMLSDYLRGFYLGNAFAKPGTVDILGAPLDARRIDMPVYALATVDDHITPWRSCYAVSRIVSGPVRFVLGGSGHVAGIVNPPSRVKYGYWTGDDIAPDPATWLAGAAHQSGSWWTDWAAWLHGVSGPWVDARLPGAGGLPALADAPGTNVRVKLDA